jgi:hypothetical protein
LQGKYLLRYEVMLTDNGNIQGSMCYDWNVESQVRIRTVAARDVPPCTLVDRNRTI